MTNDTTAPTVSVTAPRGGATVSGTVTVTATATDNVGVAGVQFLSTARSGRRGHGRALQRSWDTTTATNGAHTLTAVARDAAGNTTTSAPVPSPSPTPPRRSAAFVQVNAATPQTNQSSVTVTYTNAQIAGDTNILAIGWNNTTSNITSVTDSAGNTYQLAVPTARGSGVSQAIYYASNIKAAAAGTNTVTVTFNTATPFIDIRALEYSGLDPVNPFDVGASASGNGTSANSGRSPPPPQRADLRGRHTTGGFSAAGTNFTNRIITPPDGDIAEDRFVTATGTYSATAPLSGSAWLMQVADLQGGGRRQRRYHPTDGGHHRPRRTTVSGTVTLAATASDNVGVAGVQFLVDNTPLGAEDTASPYSVSWNTTTAPTAPTRLPQWPATPPATSPPRRRSPSLSPMPPPPTTRQSSSDPARESVRRTGP